MSQERHVTKTNNQNSMQEFTISMKDDNILISDQKELIPYIEQCDGGDSFEKRIRCSSYRKVLSNRWDAIVN